jgi:hypothetical protein
MDRRSFLASGMVVGGALVVNAQAWQHISPVPGADQSAGQSGAQPATPPQPPTQSVRPAKPPALVPELVREFVGAAHGNLEKTKSMLAETPGLLNATWDWGGGDFEKAIGGAGHMGRPDIANFLIAQGAHFDIFVAAMLGRVDIVKAALTAYPNLAQSKGPHGISLMTHAEKGGESALAVVEFLKGFRG